MEWKKVKLGEVCDRVCSGGTPNSRNSKYYDGGIPWLNTKEIDFGRIYSTERTISQEGLENSSAKWIDENSVIVAMYGATAGKVAVSKIRLTTNQACCNLHIDEKKADYNFVYYYLLDNFSILASLANGGAQQNLNAQIIKDFLISLPPLDTQRRIAAILSSLDDKIENNNRINRNLEAQAQALFKAWFVDFEPWGGTMPDDWKEYELGEFLPVKTGKKDANIASKIGTYPFFSCAQDILYTDNYSFDGNAILVAGNGDFNVKWYRGRFEAYQRTYVLIPDDARYLGWLFYAVKHNLDKITSGARGSVIKFITKGNLENFAFVAPKDLENCEIIDKFNIINENIEQNHKESQRLAQLRDTLLPKLMKGEIEV